MWTDGWNQLNRSAAAGALLILLLQVGCESNPVLRQQGYDAVRAGDYGLAREKFTLAAERLPNDYLAQYHLGVVQLELDQPLDAQLALERALAVRRDDRVLTPKILDKLAEALFRQDRVESLHAFLADVVRKHRTTADYLRQADYLAKTGDLDTAQLAFRKAAYFAEPGDAAPYLAVANFYEVINDVPNAIKALRHAYYIYPEHPKLPDRFRRFGLVPGPTLRLEPPKPPMLHDKSR